MIPFQTTPEEFLKLAPIVVEMKEAGLEPQFIVEAWELAKTDQGVYDLMVMWVTATDAGERDETIADIQDTIDDYRDAPAQPEKRPDIRFTQFGDVTRQVQADKARLRLLIDRHGGVSEVARRTGIPQPSLSRMLNSASVPRRSTLFKIANALGLPESEIAETWTR